MLLVGVVVKAGCLSLSNLCLEDEECRRSFDGKSNPTSQILQWHHFYTAIAALELEVRLPGGGGGGGRTKYSVCKAHVLHNCTCTYACKTLSRE